MLRRSALMNIALFALVLATGSAPYRVAFLGEKGIPERVNYQGYLTDPTGNPINNPSLSMTFRIFDAAIGGSQLWTETQTVSVEKGLFNVILGEVNPIPPASSLLGRGGG